MWPGLLPDLEAVAEGKGAACLGCGAMAPRRHRFTLVLLAAVLVVTTGCSDDDGTAAVPGGDGEGSERVAVTEAQLGPFEVDRRDFAPPGTSLGATLTVPPGALLVGGPFPTVDGAGFRAQFLLVGDPVTTYNGLQDQAARLGMGAAGGCLSQGGNVTCRARFIDRADGEVLAVDLRRQVRFTGVVSGLAIAYSPPGSVDVSDASEPGGVPPTDPLAAVALPPGPVGPPAPTDFALALRPRDGRVPVLETGSEIVAPVAPCACGGEGWTAVMKVTAPVRDVMAAYARQFADLGTSPDIAESLRNNLTSLSVRVGQGRQFVEIRARQPDDGPVYLLLTVRER